MKVAYGTDKAREMGAKSGKRKNEIFTLVGRVEKTPSMSTAVYVSRWRGDTTVEIHECEKLLYDWSRSGSVVFIDISLIDQFIRLLEQARGQARAIRALKKK